MYSFNGRSAIPYSFQRNSAPDDAAAAAAAAQALADGKSAEKQVDSAKSNGQENEVDDRPIRLPDGGKHKKHKVPHEVRRSVQRWPASVFYSKVQLPFSQVPNDQDAVIPMPYDGAKGGFGENGRPVVIPVSVVRLSFSHPSQVCELVQRRLIISFVFNRKTSVVPFRS